MSEKKFQVFISSTYDDLKDERQLIMKSILEMGDIPVGMEMFNAGDEEQWKTITKTIDNCDYYVLIVAHRYGSKKDEKSYTHMEYEYAISRDIPVLRFVIDESAAWPTNKSETKAADKKKLKEFKSSIVQNKMVAFWNSCSDLESKFIKSYVTAKNNYPRMGWVKANSAPSIEMAQEISRLSAENASMREELKKVSPLLETHGLSHDELVRVLSKCMVDLEVRFEGEKQWKSVTTVSLWSIFNHLCINLDSISNSLLLISTKIALILCPAEKSQNKAFCLSAPIPTNTMKEWLIKLEAMGLVKNVFKDDLPTEKWLITPEGRALYLFYLRKGLVGKKT